jgi:glycosyltransferase involved in cell wall biosynthesis
VALAFGRAILASDLPCFVELVSASGALWTYANGDAVDLQEKLGAMLGDSSLRGELSTRALEYAAAHTWSEIARRTAVVYEELRK